MARTLRAASSCCGLPQHVVCRMKTNKITKYLNGYLPYADAVKRWHMLLFILAIIIIVCIIEFLPINSGPSKEQIAKHKALINDEVSKATAFIECDTGLRHEESKKIAFIILSYYWDQEINPKRFTCIMVELLGKRNINTSSGDKETDEIKRDLGKLGLEASLLERKERLTFKVDFKIKDKIGTDVFNIFLPSYDIERVNTR